MNKIIFVSLKEGVVRWSLIKVGGVILAMDILDGFPGALNVCLIYPMDNPSWSRSNQLENPLKGYI